MQNLKSMENIVRNDMIPIEFLFVQRNPTDRASEMREANYGSSLFAHEFFLLPAFITLYVK